MFISATNFPSKLIPQIHQNPQQQQKHDLWRSRSRAWGVAKTVFGLPMLHGKHYFFWSPCSVGMRFVTFATPPQRECDFFTFAARPQREARKSWTSHLGIMLRTRRRERCKKQIATKIDPSFCVYERDALFDIVKNSISVLRMVRIPQGIHISSPLAFACVRIRNQENHTICPL